MAANREKVKSTVLEGVKKHKSAKKKSSLQKNIIRPFTSVSAICNYLYEFEFFLDNARLKEAKQEGRKLGKYVLASENTVRSAIDELIEEGFLQWNGTEYILDETFSAEREQFPILKIADRIPVTMLLPEDIMFLSAPNQYATAIADYINAVFYKRDVVATAMGDLIMCMSVRPKETFEDGFKPDPEHYERFFSQLTGALADFDLSLPDFKYGDEYYWQYGQHHDPFFATAVDELARNLATFDGREFNKRTYEKCKYFMSLAMKGIPVPPSVVEDLQRDDPELYDYIDEFFKGILGEDEL